MAEISTQAIDAAYQKYLKRTPQAHEYQFWTGNQDYEAGIANSPEAQTVAKGDTYSRTYAPTPGFVTEKLNDPTQSSEKYNWARAAQEYGTGDLAALVNYYNTKYGANASVAGSDAVNFGGGPVDVLFDQEGERRTQFNPIGAAAPAASAPAAAPSTAAETPKEALARYERDYWAADREQVLAAKRAEANWVAPGTPAAPNYQPPQAPSAQGQTFSDPATAQWEQQLRTVIDRLNQPVPVSPQQAQWEQTIKDLMARLNQPVPELSAAQKEVRNTQVLDPLTRERDAQKQRVIQQYAARGMQPGRSGIVDAALQDIDRQFAQLQTTTNANFSVDDIARMDAAFKQNEERAIAAANLSASDLQRQDQTFQENEARAINATNLFKQIPQLADTRFSQASQSLSPTNPAQLLALQSQIQQEAQRQANYGSAQDAAFWNELAQLFAGLVQ